MRYKLKIPFIVLPTELYKATYPNNVKQLEMNTTIRYMIDYLSYLLLYIGGIHSKWYKEDRNLLSPLYNSQVIEWLLMMDIDYDEH